MSELLIGQLKTMPIPDGPFILAIRQQLVGDRGPEFAKAVGGYLKARGGDVPIILFVNELDDINLLNPEVMLEFGWQRIPPPKFDFAIPYPL